jgi:hypothetical protein
LRDKLLNVLRFILKYVLWLVSCAGGFYLLLRVRSTILLATAGMYDERVSIKWSAIIIDRWGLIIIAIVLLIFVGLIEYFYSQTKTERELFSRFLFVTGVELLVLALLDAMFQLVIGIDARTTITVLMFVGELVLGIAFVSHRAWLPALRQRLKRREAQEPDV